MSKKVGRKPDLTIELIKEIKQSILDGNDLKTTANIIGIDKQKLYNWKYDNCLNISDKIEHWKLEYKLSLADKNIDDILKIGATPDKVTLKVVADMSKFVKETLDKKHYSKQVNTDITSDGKPLPILSLNALQNDIQTDKLNEEDSESEKED